MTIPRVLFYLLCTALPIQLGKHFFFPFSTISGVRVDYLAPTVYLTDIIVFFVIISSLITFIKHRTKSQKQRILKGNNKRTLFVICYVFSVICYLLFNSLFVASNVGAALYRFIKISEFIALGLSIIYLRPKIHTTILSFSIGLFYTALIAMAQFLLQRSVGGWLWFLGERSFTSVTPSIAAFSWGGKMFLRSYATFAHPNVLGGYLSAVLTLIASRLFTRETRVRIWYIVCFVLGATALVLTFSRVSCVIGLAGMGTVCLARLPKRAGRPIFRLPANHVLYVILCASIIISSFIFLFLPLNDKSVYERKLLTQEAIKIAAFHPVFGAGLNNFSKFAAKNLFHQASPYIFQPVHSIYLLTLAETGIVGVVLLFIFIAWFFRQAQNTPFLLKVVFIQLLILGMFDHYLFTLQQGQLLFTIVIALIFTHGRIVRNAKE